MDELLQLASPVRSLLWPRRRHARLQSICLVRGSDNSRIVGTLARKDIRECVDYSFKHNNFMHFTERKLEDFNQWGGRQHETRQGDRQPGRGVRLNSER